MTYVAPAYLVSTHWADDLTNYVLSTDEMLFHVYALHYVSSEKGKKDFSQKVIIEVHFTYTSATK